MADYQYGILTEPSSYWRSNDSFEMGWIFTAVKDLYFYGFRVKSPIAVEKKCRLWDASRNEIAVATLTAVANEWVEVLLDKPILLEAGKEYTISTWNDRSYFYYTSSGFTFNTNFITYKTGKASFQKGKYPAAYSEDKIYPVIDCLISDHGKLSDMTKYLIRNANSIYTVIDGALSELAGELNSALFMSSGVDTIPDGALLLPLSTPEILCWTNGEDLPTLTATVTGVPHPQTIISDKIYLTDKSITGIESVLATCEGDLVVAVSFDDKQTWKAWNGKQWATLSDDNTGMSKETLEGITFEQWNELYTGATGFYIRVSLLDTTQSVEKIVFDFSN